VETGEIIPLGSVKPEKVDVRILAATNKNLTKEVERGNFREDLFYRLNVVNIKIPPLRERKADIPLFIDYFINHFNIIQEKRVTGVSPEALEILLNHYYPGNIRELRNIMEYVFIFCTEGEVLEKHLPEYLKAASLGGTGVPAAGQTLEDSSLLESIPAERERILDALDGARWNKTKAAEVLGIDRITLWRKMKKYDIK
jgi:transcriptional regulator with PAS, ATPase and Fis domain